MKTIVPVLVGVSLALACAAGHAQEAAKDVLKVSIERESLRDALNDWAQQTGNQLIAEIKGDFVAPKIEGKLTAQEALERLLEGTPLTYQWMGERLVAVKEKPLVVPAALQSTAVPSTRRRVRVAQLHGNDDTSDRERGAARSAAVPPVGTAPRSREVDDLDEDMEVIVVTAQKRLQRLQDVPISISVVNADEIDRRGLVSAEDYLRGIPGVNQVGETFGTSIVIRGIETTPSGQNFSSGTTVATYFGETPTTNSAGLTGGTNVDLKLVDIQRVEVLRGPQGTAFGNSSLGGAVRTIPVSPKLNRFEGKVGLSYSATSGEGSDNNMIQAVGNLPLIADKLAIRATGYRYEDSGFYRNVAGSDPDVQTALAAYDAQAFATNEGEVGSTNYTGGRIAALLQASNDLKLTFSYLTQTTEIDGQSLAGTGIYEQTLPQVAPEHVVRGQKGGASDTEIDLANATMEYDLDWGTLFATFSYIESGSLYSLPLSSTIPFSELATSDHRERSGEIRLTTNLEGAWNFLGGLYSEKLKDEGTFDDLWYGSPESNIFGADRALGDYRDERELEQKAAFAEISWRFLRDFTLTGGARAYDYERTGRVETFGAFYGDSVTTTAGDATGTSFRGNLSYKPNDNSLVYASWSEGFRLGKPQPGLPPGVCDLDGNGIVDGTGVTINETKRVESDEVDNIELGGKFTMLNRRLTIAADVYRIDWTGVPSRVTPPCGLGYIANAGGAISEGIEFQATLYVSEAFRVDVGGSSVSAKLTKDAPALNAFDGDRLPGAPKLNANLGLQYEFDIGGYQAFVRADSIYVDTYFGNFQESAQTKAGGYVKVDTSARVAIKNFNIDLFVRNLTDADDFTFRGIGTFGPGPLFGYRLRPRTVGLQLGYTF